METTKLTKGEKYTFTVIEVKEHASDFKPQHSNAAIKYCHLLLVKNDRGEEFTGQICTDYAFYKDCQEGDNIQVLVKSENKGNYTFAELSNLSARSSQAKDQPADTGRNHERIINNPPMAGTAAAIAMQCATQLIAAGDAPPGEHGPDPIPLADVLLEWLLLKS